MQSLDQYEMITGSINPKGKYIDQRELARESLNLFHLIDNNKKMNGSTVKQLTDCSRTGEIEIKLGN